MKKKAKNKNNSQIYYKSEKPKFYLDASVKVAIFSIFIHQFVASAMPLSGTP